MIKPRIVFLFIVLIIWPFWPASLVSDTSNGRFERAEEHFFNGNYRIARDLFQNLRASDPENHRIYSYLGDIHLLLEEYDRAEEFYLLAIEISPRPAGEHFRLGQVYYLRQNFAESLEQFQLSRDLDPTIHEARFFEGLIHLALKDREQTVAAWQDYLNLVEEDPQQEKIIRAIEILQDPDFDFAEIDDLLLPSEPEIAQAQIDFSWPTADDEVEAAPARQRSYLRPENSLSPPNEQPDREVTEDESEENATSSETEAIDPTIRPDPENIENLSPERVFERAMDLIEDSPEAAVNLFRTIPEDDPLYGLSRYNKCIALEKMDQNFAAADACERAFRSEHPDIYRQEFALAAADIPRLNQNYDQAEQVLNDYLDREQGNAEIFNLQGQVYTEAGKYAAAAEAFARSEQWLSLNSSNAENENNEIRNYTALQRARNLERAGNIDQARSIYETMYESDNEDEQVLIHLADLEKSQGNDLQASEYLDRLLYLDPGNKQALILSVQVYDNLGRSFDSMATMQRLLSRFSDDIIMQLNAGRLFQKHGEMGRAEAAYQSALELSPSQEQYHEIINFYRQIQSRELLQIYEKLLADYPDDARALEYLGFQYINEVETRARAIELLRKYLSLRPDSANRSQIEEILRQYGGDNTAD